MACKHEWKICSLNYHGIDTEFRCSKCGRFAIQVKRYNRKSGREEYVIRMIAR